MEHKNGTGVMRDFLSLLLKIAVILGMIWISLHYVYGVFRIKSLSMKPSLKDGDLVFYYRFAKAYQAGDIVVYTDPEGVTAAGRVIAIKDEEVDIDENGLKLDGAYQQEPEITVRTRRFEEGQDFPIQVSDGEVFVLGDNRTEAKDSRVYGCIKESSIKGRVIGIFRRRNF